jgi:hypothetical protein
MYGNRPDSRMEQLHHDHAKHTIGVVAAVDIEKY